MTKITRELLDSLTFRTFTKNDYFGFGGVESPVPLIAENRDEGIVVVIDGDFAELYAETGDGGIEAIDSVENIRELPYKSEKQLRIEAEIEALKKSIAVSAAAIAALELELN